MFSLFLLALPPLSQAAAPPSRLEIALGESASLPAQKAVVINPRVLKAFIKGGKLVLVGRAAGNAGLQLKSSKVDIVVYSAPLKAIRQNLTSWLENEPNIHVSVEPKKIVLQGAVEDLFDWKELLRLKKRYKESLAVEARPSPTLQRQIVDEIASSLHSRSITSVSPRIEAGEVVLRSNTQSREGSAALEQLRGEWGISEAAQNNSDVEVKPLVEVEVVIAEVRKSFARGLGLRLPDSYQASLLPADGFASFGVKGSPLDIVLNAFVNEANGRVLANPKLLCRSGETAKFLAGGELPLKVSSWKTTEVLWKQYGVLLHITPQADLKGAISTKIMTEISLIDEGHKIDGIPGMLTNRVETHFDLRASRTIALSGLLRREVGKGSDGLAALSEIPILGEIFKSRNFRESRSELVIFVTPRIVTTDSEQQPRLPPVWHEDRE